MKDPVTDRTLGPQPVDFAILPPDVGSIDFSRIKAEKFILPNGVPVFWVRMGKSDILKIEVIFEAGYYYQPANLVASFTNHLLKEGTTTKSSAEISSIIDFYGSSLSCDTDKDRASISLYSQSKHLHHLVPLLADLLTNPSFPQQEFDILLSNKRQQFQVDMQRVSYLAGRKMQETMYGQGHPYGMALNEADFEKLTLNLVRQFFLQYYTPDRCTVIVAGADYPPLIDLLNEHLGNYGRGAKNGKDKAYSLGQLPYGQEFLIPKEGALQNAIRVGTRSILPSHEDYTALKVLNTLFGGYFGSRLMKNIREDKGYTYGIGSALLPYRETGAFIIYTEAGAKVARLAMDQIFIELDRLQQEDIPAQEINLVVNYMIGSFLRSIDGVFEVASRLKEMLFFNLPEDYYLQHIKDIQQITPERLKVMAGRYLNPDRMFKVMAGTV